MIRITTDSIGTEVDLSGSVIDLNNIGMAIGDWAQSDSQLLEMDVDIDFDPAPAEAILRKFVLSRSSGPIRLDVQGTALQASGATDSFAIFAQWFQFDQTTRDGYHVHFDNIWGNDFIDPATVPLVIRCRTI